MPAQILGDPCAFDRDRRQLPHDRQLKVFETAARHLSFSRAAEELHLTQPAVSAQIRELEGHAGLPLFERLGRRLYLTAAGEEMLAQSRAILGQFRDAEEAMSRLKGIAGGTLEIAVISAGDYFFPRLLAVFAARHPGVKLNLAVHNREGLLRCLGENLSDLAVMVRPPADGDTLAIAFAPHAYVIVASPEHPLASDSAIPLVRVLAEPFVVRERGSDTANAMREAFGDEYAKLHIAMEIASNETIKQAVIAGLGLSFLSAHAIALEREVGRLVVLDVEGFPSKGNWYVVQRRTKRLPPVAAAFRSFLLEDGARLIASLASTDSRSVPAVQPKRRNRHGPPNRAPNRTAEPAPQASKRR